MLFAALALVPFALLTAPAQQPAKSAKPAVQRDATADADSASDDADEARHPFTTGVSVGGLSYEGGRSERATSVVLRWRALPWLSIGVTPTFARSSDPSGVALRQTTTRSGLTDLPIEIGADHSFDAALSPSLSAGLGVTLPVGDTASGFGSGSVGTSISIGGGLALSDRLAVHAGVGRSLTDFGIQSTFNGTASEFADVGLSLRPNDQWSMSIGLDGDVGQVDPTYGRAASLSGGVSVSIPYVSAISLNASRGISGATPSWSFAIGVGTDFASIGSTGMAGAATRLRRAFGGGTHGLVAKGKAQTAGSTRRRHP